MEKYHGQLECIQCGYICGYRRDTPFGGVAYDFDEEVPDGVEVVETEEGYTIPVDDDDVCVYLEKLDNGFTRCSIHDKKPRVCKLYYCLPGQKARQLQVIVDELWQLQHLHS